MRSAGVSGGGRPAGSAGARRRRTVLLLLGAAAVVTGALLWRRSRAASPTPVRTAPAVEPVTTRSSWFDAPVPTDTSTPPMGIPTSAPERSPGATGPVPRLPVAPPEGAAEVTDPGLRLGVGSDGHVPGGASAEDTDRIAVVTVAGAPPSGPRGPVPSRFPAPPAGAPVPVASSGGAAGPRGVPARDPFVPGAGLPGAGLPGAGPAGAGGPGAAAAGFAVAAGGPLTPHPAPRPPHRWGLGAYLVAEAVFLGVSALMGFAIVGQDPIPAGVLAAALGVPTVAAALVGLLVTRLRGNGPVVDLQLSPTARDVGLGFAFGFGGLFLTIPASLVYVSVVGEDASSAVGDIFGGITAGPGVALLIVVIVVLVAPLCEEILYRGLLWGGLTRLGANRWLAFAVTTIIFALAHFEWPRALLLLVVALPLGLARVYSDGLLAPVIAHQVNNLLPGIGLYLMLTGTFPAL